MAVSAGLWFCPQEVLMDTDAMFVHHFAGNNRKPKQQKTGGGSTHLGSTQRSTSVLGIRFEGRFTS